ncbi:MULTISPECIES: SIMPL domain-containing protein [Paenibacillus]|uniref:DUF541 domain-containing protein n=1 Tax=Paenibacillus campinasensis TaxID=66347 RepID=A0ABW9T4X3_9BACL|nr:MULTISPECIES: SIMPL domain-containing protein [Paenibacillus]MUG67219.1 DUF541 domain-containing protein [Paenibacillus campinasensis]PAK48140.1 SIMPL domain-containing protein [Paenibacillus sp. 7541]
MNKWVKRVGAVMIAGTLLTGGAAVTGIGGATEAYAAETPRSVVTVVGKGEISVKPDIVYLSIGSESTAATAKEAQRSNAQKVQKITALLKDTWKINEKDIKTEQFFVQPNYTYSDEGGRTLKSYTAYHSLEVTLLDLTKVGDVLDSAADAGANIIGNARFSVADRDAYEAQVIEKAIANADLKARAIANAAKRQLGAIINVSEGSAMNDIITFAAADGLASKAESAGTSLEPGEIKIVTQLNVQYELK